MKSNGKSPVSIRCVLYHPDDVSEYLAPGGSNHDSVKALTFVPICFAIYEYTFHRELALIIKCFALHFKGWKIIMETPFSLAKAPDGNAGVYGALKSSGLLEDMASRGIKYVDCYGVDNVMVRVADPTFLGYFINKGATSL